MGYVKLGVTCKLMTIGGYFLLQHIFECLGVHKKIKKLKIDLTKKIPLLKVAYHLKWPGFFVNADFYGHMSLQDFRMCHCSIVATKMFLCVL